MSVTFIGSVTFSLLIFVTFPRLDVIFAISVVFDNPSTFGKSDFGRIGTSGGTSSV